MAACLFPNNLHGNWQQYNMYSRVHNLYLKCTKFGNVLPIIRRDIRPGSFVHFILVYVSK